MNCHRLSGGANHHAAQVGPILHRLDDRLVWFGLLGKPQDTPRITGTGCALVHCGSLLTADVPAGGAQARQPPAGHRFCCHNTLSKNRLQKT